jgi:hypothetical protein
VEASGIANDGVVISGAPVGLTASGGSAYSWSTGDTSASIMVSPSETTTYTVTATDVTGCTGTATTTITVPPSQSSAISVAETSCTINDGKIMVGNSVTLFATSGNSFVWSTLETTASITVTPSVETAYTVTATYPNSYTASATYTVYIVEAPTATVSETDNSCTANDAKVLGTDPAIVTVAPVGASPFTYAWSNGGGSGISANYTNSTVGNYLYTVTVTSTDGCTVTATQGVSVVAPPVPMASISHITCNGLSDGSVDLSVSAGLSPYNYVWTTAQTTQDLSGLVVGTYRVTVTDANGCTGSNTSVVTEPPVLSGSIVGVLATCLSTNGTANLTVTGGTTPYQYVWNNSTSTEDLSGLGFGTYTVTVTDNKGCTKTSSTTLGTTCRLFTGKVKWRTDPMQGVGAATVALSGNTAASVVTGVDGLYSMIGDGGNFVVTPTKSTGKLNGVTALDISRISQYIGGTLLFSDPYDFIASDINKSNAVTTTDVTILHSALLNNPIALNQFKKSWRFVPMDYTFVTPYGSPAFWNFPEQRTYSAITMSQENQDFAGIKIGDLVAPSTNPALKPAPAVPVVFSVPNLTLQSDSIVEVPFRCRNFNDLLALQACFWFNPAVLSLENIVPVASMPFQTGNFGTWDLSEGQLRLVWAVASAHTLLGQPESFRLRFRVLEGGQSLQEVLKISGKQLEPMAWHTDNRPEPVELSFYPVTESQQRGETTGAFVFALYQNEPNPFEDKTTIGFTLPVASAATLTVYDEIGRVVFTEKGDFEKGYNAISLDRALLNTAGVLYYTLKTATDVATKKMIQAK